MLCYADNTHDNGKSIIKKCQQKLFLCVLQNNICSKFQKKCFDVKNPMYSTAILQGTPTFGQRYMILNIVNVK